MYPLPIAPLHGAEGIEMTAQQAFNAGQVPMGWYVVTEPMGRVVRITENIYSFAAITYQATRDGLRRVF